jgi:hypothetical protein
MLFVDCNLGAAVALTPPLWNGSSESPSVMSSKAPPLPPLNNDPHPFPVETLPNIGLLAVPIIVSFSAAIRIEF